MNKIIEDLGKIGIVPVIKIDDAKDAKPLANALIKGGLPCAEVTFRTSAAKEAIKIMTSEFPEMLVGAGTVLTCQQVDDALEAGAKFIVSPGLNPEVVKYCISKDVPVVPGCANASDIEIVLSLGLDVVKFFPAEPLGGLKMIKALAGPYVNVKFMPTGGINEKNVCDYLAYDKIVCCGGTWMIDSKAIKEGRFDVIEELTRNAVRKMLGIEIAHIGVNAPDNYQEVADEFSKLLMCENDVKPKSIFAGSTVEVMMNNFGTCGHVGYKVNNVERAVRYYQSLGYTFDYENYIGYNDDGSLKVIYFEKEIGGFKVHLVQK